MAESKSSSWWEFRLAWERHGQASTLSCLIVNSRLAWLNQATKVTMQKVTFCDCFLGIHVVSSE